MKEINKITPLEQNFSQWFIDVVTNGNLIEYGPVKGTIIFKPNAYGIWEAIQEQFNKILKKNHVKNVYLPMLIPAALINQEKDHIAGFAPELATVTQVGDKKLNEHIYIRPTSEVLFAQLFKSEIHSYQDLPLMYNQWANVLRWEKTTNPFLRTTEFLWQEGHTCHQSKQEAIDLTKQMIKTYESFVKEYLALPVIVGLKTESEKFAGAVATYTIEAMMKDGKALQSATSHYLGQNFSKIYGIDFKNNSNQFEHVYQTSWGLSTRIIGALIMAHGDNRGIIIPPKIAPYQIDILEILANKNPDVRSTANQIKTELEAHNFRIRIDQSDKSFGFKAAQSEIEGVPLRIEIGPKDLANNQVTIVRRDTLEKTVSPIDHLVDNIKNLLNEIQNNLYNQALTRLENNLVYTNNYQNFKELIKQQKFVIIPLCDDPKWEKQIKDETTATSRCIPLELKLELPKSAQCIFTNQQTNRFVIFAKAY